MIFKRQSCNVSEATVVCWSLYNLVLKWDSSTGVFLRILQTFSGYLFWRTPEQLLLTFYCNSLIKKNLSDVSNIGCLVFFGNFEDKHLQSSLLFTLRLQFIFKYLKSQNKRVLLQTRSTKPHTNFMLFLFRRSRIVITSLFKNTHAFPECVNENLFT